VLVPQEELLDDQAGLNRLAQTDVVSDQQVRARHADSSDHRFKLVVLERDARPERCLQHRCLGVVASPAGGMPPSMP
jgi:hypothetical protein